MKGVPSVRTAILGAMAFAAAAFSAQAEKQMVASMRAQQRNAPTAGTAGDALNSRPRGANMAAIRAARKARNVKRHRAQCKGKHHA